MHSETVFHSLNEPELLVFETVSGDKGCRGCGSAMNSILNDSILNIARLRSNLDKSVICSTATFFWVMTFLNTLATAWILWSNKLLTMTLRHFWKNIHVPPRGEDYHVHERDHGSY